MGRSGYILRQTLVILRGVALTFISGIFLYFTIAIFFSFLPTHPPENKCEILNKIFLNTNGVHVDFIIPVNYLEPSFKSQLGLLPATHFVAFGWGDRNFYIKTPEWSDLTFSVTLKALFLKSKAAMHVTSYPWHDSSWKPLLLCDQQKDILIQYIKNSFEKDKDGLLIKLDFEGYNKYDAFFEAKGNFSLFNTCNVWVNRALKKSEVKTAVWTLFDFGVLYHIK